MNIQTFVFTIPDLYQQNYIIQPYSVEDNLFIFVYRTTYRDPDLILVDIYRDELNSANKIYSGLKLTENAMLCLPNYELDFPYGVRCINTYELDTVLTPQTVSSQFLIEFENVLTSDYSWDNE